MARAAKATPAAAETPAETPAETVAVDPFATLATVDAWDGPTKKTAEIPDSIKTLAENLVKTSTQVVITETWDTKTKNKFNRHLKAAVKSITGTDTRLYIKAGKAGGKDAVRITIPAQKSAE